VIFWGDAARRGERRGRGGEGGTGVGGGGEGGEERRVACRKRAFLFCEEKEKVHRLFVSLPDTKKAASVGAVGYGRAAAPRGRAYTAFAPLATSRKGPHSKITLSFKRIC